MPFAIDRTTDLDTARWHAAAGAHAMRDPGGSEAGPLQALFQKHDALEQLIADAGPLGKFKTDQPGQMPSGTSVLTTRIDDILNRIAANLGMPVERILSSNPSIVAAAPRRVAAEIPPGQGPAASQPGHQIQDLRPAIAAETENRAAAYDRGSRAPGNA